MQGGAFDGRASHHVRRVEHWPQRQSLPSWPLSLQVHREFSRSPKMEPSALRYGVSDDSGASSLGRKICWRAVSAATAADATSSAALLQSERARAQPCGPQTPCGPSTPCSSSCSNVAAVVATSTYIKAKSAAPMASSSARQVLFQSSC